MKDLGRFPDLRPTLLDYADLGVNGLSMAGKSLRPVMEGTGPSPYEVIVSGFHDSHIRCIRTETHSLILGAEGDTDELYDLDADPRERKNIISDSGNLAGDMASLVGTVYLGKKAHPRGVQGKMEVAGTALE